MKMTIPEALDVLDIRDKRVTKDLIKYQYRRLASEYHPDKNPGGLRKMQNINVAYDYLSSLTADNFPIYDNSSNDHSWAQGLRGFRKRGKMYIYGNTYPVREKLKEHGYRWNPDEKLWWRYDY